MNKPFPHPKLFDPINVNGMTIRNRIVMPAMQLRLGLANPRARAFYLQRAGGGAGAIIMCATSVDLLCADAAWGREGGLRRFVERMRTFTDEIRQKGAKIGIQLWHGNQWPAGNGAPLSGAEQVAPSAFSGRRELTVSEIRAIIDKFALAARSAREAGFDFVEIHGAHGYLPCQFFSPADNRRNDRYGGDLSGRMRFGLELVEKMRERTGDSFPIWYRLGAFEDRPGGITAGESIRFAAALEGAGVDVFDVSLGHTEGYGAAPGPDMPMGSFIHLSGAVKSAVSVPVMGVGRINSPKIAESILAEGRADMIGIGRQLIADPFWPEKARTGEGSSIRSCASCNNCFTPLVSSEWKPGDKICRLNERAGRELEPMG
jgi:2,4-dienoyl-CoA reductase (NADPH2)